MCSERNLAEQKSPVAVVTAVLMGLAVFCCSPPDVKTNRRKNMWYVGQKVRCVNDRFPNSVFEWGSNLPKKGEIYTIRSIKPTRCAMSGVIGPGFLLEELSNPFDRLQFDPSRFVPIYRSEISLKQALRRTMVRTVNVRSAGVADGFAIRENSDGTWRFDCDECGGGMRSKDHVLAEYGNRARLRKPLEPAVIQQRWLPEKWPRSRKGRAK
jgi:hypothetical protein